MTLDFSDDSQRVYFTNETLNTEGAMKLCRARAKIDREDFIQLYAAHKKKNSQRTAFELTAFKRKIRRDWMYTTMIDNFGELFRAWEAEAEDWLSHETEREAVKFLRSIKDHTKKIQRREIEVEQMEEECKNLKAVVLTERVKSSGIADPMQAVERAEEARRLLDHKKRKLYDDIQRLKRMVDELPDETDRLVLTERYIEFAPKKQIKEQLNVTLEELDGLFKRVHEKFTKIYIKYT